MILLAEVLVVNTYIAHIDAKRRTDMQQPCQ
jgi:hypothetical protein